MQLAFTVSGPQSIAMQSVLIFTTMFQLIPPFHKEENVSPSQVVNIQS